MAPETLFRQHRRLAASDLETTGEGFWPPQNERATSERQSGHPALSLQMLNQMRSPGFRSSPANILREVKVAAAASTSSLSRWRPLPNLAPLAKPRQNIEKHTEHHSIVRQESSNLKGRNWLIAGSGAPGFRSKKADPLAPKSVFSLDQRVGEFEPYPEQNTLATGVKKVTLGKPPVLAGEQPISNQDYAGQSQSFLPDRDRTVDSEQFQRTRSAVSTIHIDGSALGRWTVQHLERALGRPATGMTGVDPRSTIPRSRVAPF
jgi:hypothetical protein